MGFHRNDHPTFGTLYSVVYCDLWNPSQGPLETHLQSLETLQAPMSLPEYHCNLTRPLEVPQGSLVSPKGFLGPLQGSLQHPQQRWDNSEGPLHLIKNEKYAYIH